MQNPKKFNTLPSSSFEKEIDELEELEELEEPEQTKSRKKRKLILFMQNTFNSLHPDI